MVQRKIIYLQIRFFRTAAGKYCEFSFIANSFKVNMQMGSISSIAVLNCISRT